MYGSIMHGSPQRNGTKATPGNTLSLHLKFSMLSCYLIVSDLTAYRSEDFQNYVRGFSRRLYVSCRLPKKSSKSFRTFCTIIVPSDLRRTWLVSESFKAEVRASVERCPGRPTPSGADNSSQDIISPRIKYQYPMLVYFIPPWDNLYQNILSVG